MVRASDWVCFLKLIWASGQAQNTQEELYLPPGQETVGRFAWMPGFPSWTRCLRDPTLDKQKMITGWMERIDLEYKEVFLQCNPLGSLLTSLRFYITVAM